MAFADWKRPSYDTLECLVCIEAGSDKIAA